MKLNPLVRLTPKKAPFRRGSVQFPSLAAVILLATELTEAQAVQLMQEPLVDVDVSLDDGEHWRRFDLPSIGELYRKPVTDPALSPERAVDPTGPIVPREAVLTPDGYAAPPEAADPAVPLAMPADAPIGAAVVAADGRDGGRPVAAPVAAAEQEAVIEAVAAELVPPAEIEPEARGGRSGRPRS